jgi:hypothetical protein
LTEIRRHPIAFGSFTPAERARRDYVESAVGVASAGFGRGQVEDMVDVFHISVLSGEELQGQLGVAAHARAGSVEFEVDLPDLDPAVHGSGDLGFDFAVVAALLHLKAGVVVEEADQEDRAFVGFEAAAEFADVLDEPLG